MRSFTIEHMNTDNPTMTCECGCMDFFLYKFKYLGSSKPLVPIFKCVICREVYDKERINERFREGRKKSREENRA